jgi:phage protein D
MSDFGTDILGGLNIARQTQLSIVYQSNTANPTDVSQFVAPDLLDFEYSESLSWEADNLSLEVQDRDGKWSGEWAFDRGQTLQCTIIAKNWNAPGETLALDCGTAEIDEIEVEGPPRVVRIKCCSIPVSSGIKFTHKWQTWANTTLRAICQEIATRNNLTLTWEVSRDWPGSRWTQSDESDMHYIASQCRRFGYSMKIQDYKMIIFDERDYEAKPPVGTITYGQGGILKYKITSKSQDIYNSAEVRHQDAETQETVEGIAVPGDDPSSAAPSTGAVIFDNEYVPYNADQAGEPDPAGGATALGLRPDIRFDAVPNPNDPLAYRDENPGDGADASAMAKNKLRLKNKHEHRSEIEMLGNVKMVAGATYMLAGFAKWLDGKCIMEKVMHRVGRQGFTTTCGLRRCLVGI